MHELMARQPKAKAEFFGEKKTQRFQALFTESGLEKLDRLAADQGLSRSDFLERLVWALDGQFATAEIAKLVGVEDEENA